jgi:hypothetical protein
MSIRDKKFKWTEELELAYMRIYQALVKQGPFIHFPVPGIPIELATDASNYAIGAAIFQRVNGEIRYLGFHSRVLNKSEINYSIPKKELLSIIVHINYYRYLLGNKFFKLHTDSKALTEMIKSLERPNTKHLVLTGWLSVIADFNFEVHHIEGKKNVLPDLLSRVQKIVITYPLKKALRDTHAINHWGASRMYRYIQHNYDYKKFKHLWQAYLNYTKECSICQKVNNQYIGYALQKEP